MLTNNTVKEILTIEQCMTDVVENWDDNRQIWSRSIIVRPDGTTTEVGSGQSTKPQPTPDESVFDGITTDEQIDFDFNGDKTTKKQIEEAYERAMKGVK